jgi:hypothetical protein
MDFYLQISRILFVFNDLRLIIGLVDIGGIVYHQWLNLLVMNYHDEPKQRLLPQSYWTIICALWFVSVLCHYGICFSYSNPMVRLSFV